MVMCHAAKRIANRFCLTALFADELRFIHAHKADKNDLQRLVRLALCKTANLFILLVKIKIIYEKL